MSRAALAALVVLAVAAPYGRASPESDDPRAHDALATRTVFRAALELAAHCAGRPLEAAGWCPKPGQAVAAPDGGLTVTVNDDVELELTVGFAQDGTRHGFLIVSAEEARRPDPKPAFGTVVDFAVPGVQLFRFRADRPGDFVFLEPYGRAITGRFTVRP